tara:strand:+ start:5507 stop:6268 length:762 start_codon:yes stop_codon:yes gene_type:complete
MKTKEESTNISQKVWDDYYKTIEDGAVGCLYPNEPLVRIVSTIKKGINFDSKKFFGDEGQENSNRSGFKGECLEIGFGHTSNLLMMEEKGFVPTGIEVSKEAVIRGNKRLKQLQRNIDLVEWKDLSKLPFDDNKFDVIYGLECIYYNVDLCNILSEIKRCLKPDGYFAFSFFSQRHDYHKFIDVISKEDKYNIVKWSEHHPNPRIRGAILSQPRTKEDLYKLFDKFGERRIFTEESDFSPTYNSWWYIYGKCS